MKWNRMFPFNTKGELVSYTHDIFTGRHPQERGIDAARFVGTLRYVGYERGRSSALIIFTDDEFVPNEITRDMRRRRFPFFMSDADAVLPLMVRGVVSGSFVPHKVGQNFGWKLEVAR